MSHCQWELARAESSLKEVDERMTDFHEEMAKKEAEWGEEKLRLRKGCVEVYEDGFMKAMRQAVLFAPEIDPMRFDIDKEVVDRQLLDDFDSEQ